MGTSFEAQVQILSGKRCEYCHVPDGQDGFPHVLDHIIARQHGGETVIGNLALCCGGCNRFKGPNIASIDPYTGQLTRLFHPRVDQWDEHFYWANALLLGKIPVGRATIHVLAVNLNIRVAAREVLMLQNLM